MYIYIYIYSLGKIELEYAHVVCLYLAVSKLMKEML